MGFGLLCKESFKLENNQTNKQKRRNQVFLCVSDIHMSTKIKEP